MSSLAVQPQEVASGPGWHADIYQSHTILKVDPSAEDVSAAVAVLVAPTQLRFWTLEWVYEDDFGWDVYLFERGRE